MRILIVDDHPTNRKLLRVTLEAEGLTTVEANDGAEALAILEAEPVDAIVSDIFMPGMDGFRFCHAVRKSEKFGHLPFVIYTSTYTSSGDEKLALEAGADRYIRKPCPTGTLVSALHEVVATGEGRALQRRRPLPELEVTREYSQALIKKLEEKNADLERASARQKMLAELSQYALAPSSALPGEPGQTSHGTVSVPGTDHLLDAANTLDALFGRAASMVVAALGMEHCAVWQMLPGGGLGLRASAGGPSSDKGPGHESSSTGSGSAGPAPVDMIRDGELPVTSEATGTLVAAIPWLNGRFGVLQASMGEARSFREEDGHFLEAVAGVLATALRRQQAEGASRLVRELWERTFDSVPDLIAILDDRFHIVRANRAMAQRLGLTPEECVGHTCYQCVHGLDRPPDFCPHSLTLADGRQHMVEVHEENLGGDFLVSTTPLLDPGGRSIGSVHVARDITERKRAEEALRESEERFRNLAEGLPELVWVSDAAGKATYLNPQYRSYARADLESLEARMQLIHPEDLPGVSELWSERIRTASDFQREYRLRRHDGLYHWFLTRIVLKRTPSGAIEGWIGTSTDIHDQKLAEELLEQRVRERAAELQASEERFRQLAENIQEVFWMLEPGSQRILYVSPAYDAIWGRSRQELYERPESFLDTVHPEDRQRVSESFAAEGQVYDGEFRILRPDGTPRWIHLCSFPVHNDAGEVYRLAGVAADRTEQKAAEAALIQAERLTIAGKIAASLAHEINNPLQAALGCLELAEEALENGGDLGSFLQIARQALERTARTVTQLRSLGRPIQEGQRQPTDLNSLLADVLALNKKHLQNHNVQVVWEPGPGLPLLAVMPDSIHQVFLNLVLNAADAMSEGGQLRLSTNGCESPAGVRVVVSDTGSGISPDRVPHIFDAFYSTKSQGLGVGLFVSQNIVHQHGGRIEVESEPGVGSTFTVWLPA